MTLDKIKVKDFQSIDRGEVELGRFTVFTGPSSSGKSAFLRAAEAVVRNSFTPTQVRMGTKEAIVSVEFEDHIVEAQRGKSKSTYRLDDETFTKAGRSVPPAVAEAFRMDQIAEVETTFSTQFDKPYLIADSGAVAAKVLGTLTNVSVLHGGLREASRREREINARVKVKTSDLEQVQERLDEYSGLDSTLAELGSVKLLEAELVRKKDEILKLETLLDMVAATAKSLKSAKDSVVDLGTLPEELEKMEQDILTAQMIERALTKLKTTAAQIPRWEYENVPTYDPSLDDKIEMVKSLNTLMTRTARDVRNFKERAQAVKDLGSQILEKESEYGMLMSSIQTCPLCETPLNGEHLD